MGIFWSFILWTPPASAAPSSAAAVNRAPFMMGDSLSDDVENWKRIERKKLERDAMICAVSRDDHRTARVDGLFCCWGDDKRRKVK
jgi:hypothetical protein